MSEHLAIIIFLLLVANGSPVIAHYLFADRFFNTPVDFKKLYIDQQPLFGSSKTWRGLFASIIVTSLCATFLPVSIKTAFIIACLAMCGDLLSSFIKRRLKIASSQMAPLLDQVPESLLPLIYVYMQDMLTLTEVMTGVLIFIVLELILSKIFFHLGVRKRPY